MGVQGLGERETLVQKAEWIKADLHLMKPWSELRAADGAKRSLFKTMTPNITVQLQSPSLEDRNFPKWSNQVLEKGQNTVFNI